MSEHTASPMAIRAAEVLVRQWPPTLTGHETYTSAQACFADIIDRETRVADLLTACKVAREAISSHLDEYPGGDNQLAWDDCNYEIVRAEGTP